MAKTRLQEKYLSEAVKGMMDKFNYKNAVSYTHLTLPTNGDV